MIASNKKKKKNWRVEGGKQEIEKEGSTFGSGDGESVYHLERGLEREYRR
jgi:hypothetical protein